MNDRLAPSSRPSASDAMWRLYANRIHLWMGVAATCVLAPFAVYNAMQGRLLVGAAMAAITALFAANMIAVLRGRDLPVHVLAIFIVSIGAMTLSTFTYRGLQGVVWGYPAIVLFHILAGRTLANVLNPILALAGALMIWHVDGFAMGVRIGATLGLTIAFTNIFSRVVESANRAFDEARAQAERASLAKSQFLANMSHELRTPLNTIIGYTELLHEDARNEQRHGAVQDLKRIGDASRHLLGMIDEILDLARIEASRVDLEASSVALAAFTEELAGAAHVLARKNDNAFTVEIAQDVSDLSLTVDATRLRQCMLNLLSNACKFTERGRIVLRVAGATLSGARGVAFSVEDSGIGMSEEQLARVFEPFEQADSSINRRFGGTGLGLAITRQLIRLMGGEVTAVSASGKGSTFTLTLPLSPPAAAADNVAAGESG
jgi:signal transduction histidine kinase